jgi:hypothetical protein
VSGKDASASLVDFALPGNNKPCSLESQIESADSGEG